MIKFNNKNQLKTNYSLLTNQETHTIIKRLIFSKNRAFIVKPIYKKKTTSQTFKKQYI